MDSWQGIAPDLLFQWVDLLGVFARDTQMFKTAKKVVSAGGSRQKG
jgi:hypothetical protein